MTTPRLKLDLNLLQVLAILIEEKNATAEKCITATGANYPPGSI